MANHPWQDPTILRDAVERAGSFNKAATLLGCNPSAVKKWAKRFGIVSNNKGGSQSSFIPQVSSDELTLTSAANPRGTAKITPEELLRDHGIDPAAGTYTANTTSWDSLAGDGTVTTLSRLQVSFKPHTIVEVVLPERAVVPKRVVRKSRTKAGTQLVALVSDTHCPHVEPTLHAHWLEWLRKHRPSRIIHMGDLMNMSKPSRHRPNLDERHNDTPEQCLAAGREWWLQTIEAAGGTVEGDQLVGNHDNRLQIACAERYPDAYTVKRPGEQYPWWDLEYLLGLDNLNVTLHRPAGEYHESQIQLAKGLLLTHGTHAGPVGGAVKASPRHEQSRVQGHDHKQSATHTIRYRDGHRRTHLNVSVGAMCRPNLGYTPDPDVNLGFAAATLHQNGWWNIELARYDDRRGVLFYRDEAYTA